MALGAEDRAVDAVLRAAFEEGRDVSDLADIADMGAALGLADPLAAIARNEVKSRLRANTEAAVSQGVFGVPTIALGTDLFWGEDMTDMVAAFATDAGVLDNAELRRLKALPVGVERRA